MKRLACVLALVLLSSVFRPLEAAGDGSLTRLLNELSYRRDVKIAFSHVVTDPVLLSGIYRRCWLAGSLAQTCGSRIWMGIIISIRYISRRAGGAGLRPGP